MNLIRIHENMLIPGSRQGAEYQHNLKIHDLFCCFIGILNNASALLSTKRCEKCDLKFKTLQELYT